MYLFTIGVRKVQVRSSRRFRWPAGTRSMKADLGHSASLSGLSRSRGMALPDIGTMTLSEPLVPWPLGRQNTAHAHSSEQIRASETLSMTHTSESLKCAATSLVAAAIACPADTGGSLPSKGVQRGAALSSSTVGLAE